MTRFCTLTDCDRAIVGTGRARLRVGSKIAVGVTAGAVMVLVSGWLALRGRRLAQGKRGKSRGRMMTSSWCRRSRRVPGRGRATAQGQPGLADSTRSPHPGSLQGIRGRSGCIDQPAIDRCICQSECPGRDAGAGDCRARGERVRGGDFQGSRSDRAGRARTPPKRSYREPRTATSLRGGRSTTFGPKVNLDEVALKRLASVLGTELEQKSTAYAAERVRVKLKRLREFEKPRRIKKLRRDVERARSAELAKKRCALARAGEADTRFCRSLFDRV